MKELLVREGNDHTYRPQVLTVSPRTNQDASISTLQVDGFSSIVIIW
jgi:hypothetical protein